MPPIQKDEDRWLTSVYATVRAQREEMLLRSELLAQRHAAGELEIVGAVYHLETGLVQTLG
jgi:carbonic anhydrase